MSKFTRSGAVVFDATSIVFQGAELSWKYFCDLQEWSHFFSSLSGPRFSEGMENFSTAVICLIYMVAVSTFN